MLQARAIACKTFKIFKGFSAHFWQSLLIPKVDALGKLETNLNWNELLNSFYSIL